MKSKKKLIFWIVLGLVLIGITGASLRYIKKQDQQAAAGSGKKAALNNDMDKTFTLKKGKLVLENNYFIFNIFLFRSICNKN